VVHHLRLVLGGNAGNQTILLSLRDTQTVVGVLNMWMLDMRLKALKLFQRKPMPTWGVDISTIDFDQIKYFVRAQERQAASWEDLPADIKNTYDRMGIPVGLRWKSLRALRRISSIHCGSCFIADMPRTTSSDSPRREAAA
jgi:hypothetical protein